MTAQRGFESRCRHDMLDGTCAICKGLPDVPLLDDLVYAEARPAHQRWFPSDTRGRCARCDKPYPVGAQVAWSASESGVVGECCEAEQ